MTGSNWMETERYYRRYRAFVTPEQTAQYTDYYKGMYQLFRDYTMIPEQMYYDNIALVHQQTLRMAEGAIVECGTWKGGMAAAMMEVGGKHRQYHFYDSFEGLPPPVVLDGQDAVDWQADTDAPGYFDNCSADVEGFKKLIGDLAYPKDVSHVHKGWFEDTVRHYDGPPIAVLRLDGDWYESTLVCLQHLYKHVKEDGIVIIDDYDIWDGCSRAVHDFLAEIKSTSRIRRSGDSQIAFIHKIDEEAR